MKRKETKVICPLSCWEFIRLRATKEHNGGRPLSAQVKEIKERARLHSEHQSEHSNKGL